MTESWWAHHDLLRRGSQGPAVSDLQRALNKEPSPQTLPLSRHFDEKTEQAVRAFQRRHLLIDDGQVGPITHAILFGSNYKFSLPLPPGVTQPQMTCWAASLQSALHSYGAWQSRPQYTVAELKSQYSRYLHPGGDITQAGWDQIVRDFRLGVSPRNFTGQDLRIERIVWLLRENRMPMLLVHDLLHPTIKHTVVVYGVQIKHGAPELLTMNPMKSYFWDPLASDVLQSGARELIIALPIEAKPLPKRH
jgi:hypothetical protein